MKGRSHCNPPWSYHLVDILHILCQRISTRLFLRQLFLVPFRIRYRCLPLAHPACIAIYLYRDVGDDLYIVTSILRMFGQLQGVVVARCGTPAITCASNGRIVPWSNDVLAATPQFGCECAREEASQEGSKERQARTDDADVEFDRAPGSGRRVIVCGIGRVGNSNKRLQA